MTKIKTAFFCLIASFIISGCASTEKQEEILTTNKMEEMLAEAGAASKSGQSEKATTMLKTVAASFPTEKTPWLQLAQINFDKASYSEAIVNAEEVLQRDPNDKLANSIIAVSGLRLSNKALSDLSRQNNLSGSLRTEAQELAKLLRETIGEPVLVPAQTRTPPEPVKPVQVNQRASRKPAPKGAAVNSKREDTNSNPFGTLK